MINIQQTHAASVSMVENAFETKLDFGASMLKGA